MADQLPPDGTPTQHRQPRTARGAGSLRAVRGRFLAPFVVLYVLFIIGPALYGLCMSFFNTSLVQVRARRLRRIRQLRRGAARAATSGTRCGTPSGSRSSPRRRWSCSAFVFALLADRVARGTVVLPAGVLRAVHPAVGGRRADLDLALHPGSRAVEAGLGWIGVAAPNWLGDPNWAMPSLAITTVWWTLGFNFVLYLAGLQDIPRDLYEAASIDGAGPWQQIR